MSNSDKTSLGDRMKSYEVPSTTRKAFKGQPLVVRLDGKSFHTFTKGLKRPYDVRLSQLMVETSKALVDRFQAKIGYTQSDEITLVWNIDCDGSSEFPFDGRFQKMESLLAAYATAFFNKNLADYLPEKAEQLPIFDARAFVVPNLMEAYNAVLWRQQDATKNAISMAAQSMFSHKVLQNKNSSEMQEMMWSQHGINFNDYPAFFKRGMFVRRVKRERILTDVEMSNIPEAHRPTGPVVRSSVEAADIWLSRQTKPLDVLFFDAEPMAISGPVLAVDILEDDAGTVSV